MCMIISRYSVSYFEMGPLSYGLRSWQKHAHLPNDFHQLSKISFFITFANDFLKLNRYFQFFDIAI